MKTPEKNTLEALLKVFDEMKKIKADHQKPFMIHASRISMDMRGESSDIPPIFGVPVVKVGEYWVSKNHPLLKTLIPPIGIFGDLNP